MSTPHFFVTALDDLTAADSVLLCTAVLGKQEFAWLELAMPRSLFDGAASSQVIAVLIGATKAADGKSWKCLDNRPSGYAKFRLASEFASIPAIQKFQKAIVEDWKKFNGANAGQWAKGTTIGKSLTSPSFVAKALKTGFDAIGLSQAAYSGVKLSDWTISDLRKYAESRKAIFTWRDAKLGAFADVGSTYLELMPDPAFEKLEKEAITNPDMNMPARNIEYVKSLKSVGHSGKFAYATELQKINLPRVTGYGFRGDSRDPITLREQFSGAFTPNYTRADQNAKVQKSLAETIRDNLPRVEKEKPAVYQKYRKAQWTLLTKLGPGTGETRGHHLAAIEEVLKDPAAGAELRAMFGGSKGKGADFVSSTGQMKSFDQVNTGALDLGEYVQNEFMGGFVSVSRSVMVAKSFACGRGGNSKARDGWVYVCFVEGAFDIPLKGTHPLAKKQEFELAMPGMLEWEDVVGWRKVKSTGKFDGPIYLRQSLCKSDAKAGEQIYQLLGGKEQ